MTVVRYGLQRGTTPGIHQWAAEFETKIIRGDAAAMAALQLKASGFSPNVICAHPGWGEALFLKDVWPSAKLLSYLEFYYHFVGADVNFDPEFPESDFATAARLRVKNANNLLALEVMDAGVSPTHWQKIQFPIWAQDRITTIHDGIDTRQVSPNCEAALYSEAAGISLHAGGETLTFVSRSLEPCRGFHIFMRALPYILQKRPNAHVLIVGADGPGYGLTPSGGQSWKQLYLDEVGAELDPKRVHFLGKVSYSVFLTVLQISAVHVYLTYPFVLSWSMLEAMSAGCLVVGSRTPPVEEIITHCENGLLVDFFNPKALAETVTAALANPDDYSTVRANARASIIERYDLYNICLPRHIELVESLG